MKKLYFGAWQNFYHLSWPIRFFIEGAIFLFIVLIFYKLAKMIGRALRLKSGFVKGCVWVATEAVYLFGRNRTWAVEIDNKVMEWGEKKLDGSIGGAAAKKRIPVKVIAVFGVIVLYVAAVFVDLPLSEILQEEYLAEFAKVKGFFRQFEEGLSKGHEDYLPLFVKIEPEEAKEAMEVPAENNGKEEYMPVYIELNERGKNGANVRQEPSLNGKIVGGVNRESEILYRYQCTADEEGRYWIKIYIPADDMEGWLSGKLVDSMQLELLAGETERE